MDTNFKRRDFIKSTFALGTLFCVPVLGFKAFAQELPNVLIIGDSISMGYTPVLKQILATKANVSHPAENCESTIKGVNKLDEWLGSKKYKVIYFNFGLHDLKHVDAVTKEPSAKATDPLLTDLPTYAANLNIIVKKLKAAGAKVIFATTTPVPEHPGTPLREPEMPAKYNNAAKEVMKNNGVEVDDLYAFVLPQIKTIQIPDNVHFTNDGYEIMAKHISATISKYL
jgi:hypothetical protein